MTRSPIELSWTANNLACTLIWVLWGCEDKIGTGDAGAKIWPGLKMNGGVRQRQDGEERQLLQVRQVHPRLVQQHGTNGWRWHWDLPPGEVSRDLPITVSPFSKFQSQQSSLDFDLQRCERGYHVFYFLITHVVDLHELCQLSDNIYGKKNCLTIWLCLMIWLCLTIDFVWQYDVTWRDR